MSHPSGFGRGDRNVCAQQNVHLIIREFFSFSFSLFSSSPAAAQLFYQNNVLRLSSPATSSAPPHTMNERISHKIYGASSMMTSIRNEKDSSLAFYSFIRSLLMMLVVQCRNNVEQKARPGMKADQIYDEKSSKLHFRYSNSMCDDGKKFYPHSQFSFIIFFPHFHSTFCCLSLILISEIDFFSLSFAADKFYYFWLVDEFLVGSVCFFCARARLVRWCETQKLSGELFFYSLLTRNIFLHEMRYDDIKDTSRKRRIFIKYFSSCVLRPQLPFFASFHFWDYFFYVMKSDVDEDEVQVVQRVVQCKTRWKKSRSLLHVKIWDFIISTVVFGLISLRFAVLGLELSDSHTKRSFFGLWKWNFSNLFQRFIHEQIWSEVDWRFF